VLVMVRGVLGMPVVRVARVGAGVMMLRFRHGGAGVAGAAPGGHDTKARGSGQVPEPATVIGVGV
jgi:hypothetical protein